MGVNNKHQKKEEIKRNTIQVTIKRAILVIAGMGTLLASSASWAYDVYVSGYTRGNGTYVVPYVRSNPDGNPYNNYGYFR